MSGPDDKQKRIRELEAELADLRGEKPSPGPGAGDAPMSPTQRISAGYAANARAAEEAAGKAQEDDS